MCNWGIHCFWHFIYFYWNLYFKRMSEKDTARRNTYHINAKCVKVRYSKPSHGKWKILREKTKKAEGEEKYKCNMKYQKMHIYIVHEIYSTAKLYLILCDTNQQYKKLLTWCFAHELLSLHDERCHKHTPDQCNLQHSGCGQCPCLKKYILYLHAFQTCCAKWTVIIVNVNYY